MYERELDTALELADLADEISVSFFRGSFEVRTKPDSTPVTEADIRIEGVLRRELGSRFPADAVLGEEHGLEGTSERVWVLDPIDGTKNFAADIQIWGTLIALVVDGSPVVGVASAPALGERYWAARGAGARLNDEVVRVSSVASVEDAFVTSGGATEFVEGPLAGAYRSLASRAARNRAFGDFWGHMLVARGAVDVMLEPALRTWDWAAVQVIVEEAGGKITQFDGSPLADRGSVMTTNGLLHEEVVAAFAGS